MLKLLGDFKGVRKRKKVKNHCYRQ